MKNLEWGEDEAAAVLGAMHDVVTLDGQQEPAPLAADMLRSLRDHVFHTQTDLKALPRVQPADLAKRLPESAERHQAIQFLVLMPYIPIELDPRQIERVEQYARAMEVTPTTLNDLRMVRDERLKRLAFDYTRRGIDNMVSGGPLEKLHSVVKLAHQYVGDSKVAARYQTLENCPEGSLGQTFFRFYRDRGFPLPGEKGSFSEYAVPHDMTHILTGRNTDMEGEINVAGVEAGMSRNEFGWELLMEVILDFHLGLAFTTAGLIEPGKGHFEPEQVARGFELGTQMNIDLMEGWDPWEVVDEPVPALRERYNIEGVEGIVMPPPSAETDAHPQPSKT